MDMKPRLAADDVASGVGRVAVSTAVNGIVEIGGPEQFRLDELVRRRLIQLNDAREVIADPSARYSGAEVGERTLLPGPWLSRRAGRLLRWIEPAGPEVGAGRAGIGATPTP